MVFGSGRKVRKKSIFDIKVRSKRRAGVISIESPEAFKKSIKTLMVGRYTLGDQRALILARTMAKIQLRRRSLSTKERRQFEEIALTPVPSARRKSSSRNKYWCYDRGSKK